MKNQKETAGTANKSKNKSRLSAREDQYYDITEVGGKNGGRSSRKTTPTRREKSPTKR